MKPNPSLAEYLNVKEPLRFFFFICRFLTLYSAHLVLSALILFSFQSAVLFLSHWGQRARSSAAALAFDECIAVVGPGPVGPAAC